MLTLNLATLIAATSALSSVAGEVNFATTKVAFLSYAGGALSLRATDLTNWLTFTVPADGDGMADMQVDAGKLADLVNKLRGDTVALAVDNGALTITAGKSKRKLMGSVVEFPEHPAIAGDAVTLDTSALTTAIAFSERSRPSDERPEFDGIRLQAGHAVAYNGKGFSAAAVEGLGSVAVTLTPSTVKLLSRVPTDTIRLTIGERLVSVTWDGGSLIAKQMVGEWRFLDGGVDALIPARDHTLTVHPAELMRAVASVKPVAHFDKNAKSEHIVLRLRAGACEVDALSNAGAAVEPFDAEWDGPEVVVRLLQSRLAAIMGGYASDMPISLAITSLTADTKTAAVVFRQDARPGFVGILTQIRQ